MFRSGRSVRVAAVLVAALVLCVAAPQGFAAPAESTSAAGHEGATGHGEGAALNPLAWDSDLAVWTAVVFLLLFAVLWKFAWGPIVAALERREEHIAQNIEAAKQAQEDAKAMLADYERKLAGAADDVRLMLEEARRDAEHTKQEIVAEAKQAAQAEHGRAMRDIRTATDAAVKELSEKSADLAIELAGKVIGAKITPEERSHLVQDSLGKFAAATPSQN